MDETMNKRPSFQFYPADWRKDPQLQMCSMSTQGIWINLLCIMWEAEIEGEITGKEQELIRLVGCTPNDFVIFTEEIKRHNFGDVTICNSNVTIINRRIKRAFLEREGVKNRVRRYRKKQSNENVTPYSSTSSSTSSSKNKYMDFVLLTKEENNKLIEKFGEIETTERIIALNDYIGAKDVKYKSHYHTILMWSRKDKPSAAVIADHKCTHCGEPAVWQGPDDTGQKYYLCRTHEPKG